MRAELPVLSFLSLFCLVLILPGQLKSNTIPAVSIISWLFVCNLIHGVNSLVWAGNTGIHVPVWCDIVTKVLLGAMVAVPGAFLCICRHLEFATSRPRDEASIPTKRQTILFEVSMCIFSPILYMAFHTIVQNHRFTILEDFGCQPALYNYMPSLLIVWLPPLIISLVSLLYCVSALINVLKSRYNSWTCFPQAPKMTLGLFARRLAFATTGMLYVFAVYAFIVSWASSNLQPEISVAQLHADFSQIEVLPLDAQARVRVELVWWAVPVWSLLLCALSGEETRNGYQAIFGWVFRHRDNFDLPMHTKAEFISVTPTSSVHLLRPAWFDSVKSAKSPSASLETDHIDHVTFSHRSLSPRSLGPSPPVSPAQDASFAQSTLAYLDSDAAKQLRLPSPPLSAHPYGLTSPPPVEKPATDKLAASHAGAPSTSPADSILSVSVWPDPPRTIPSPTQVYLPDSPVRSPQSPIRSPQSPIRSPQSPIRSPQSSVRSPQSPARVQQALNRSTSLSSIRSSMSAGRLDASGYPMLPGALPARLQDVPFGGPGVLSLSSPPPPPKRAGKARGLERSLTGKSRKNEVIYMTVVQETA